MFDFERFEKYYKINANLFAREKISALPITSLTLLRSEIIAWIILAMFTIFPITIIFHLAVLSNIIITVAWIWSFVLFIVAFLIEKTEIGDINKTFECQKDIYNPIPVFNLVCEWSIYLWFIISLFGGGFYYIGCTMTVAYIMFNLIWYSSGAYNLRKKRIENYLNRLKIEEENERDS